MNSASRFLPILRWGAQYGRQTFAADGLAAVIVTVMLIPQSLAYALLAGLPPVVGLYASILPLVLYAIFGTSRTLSVGPVAVISLLTAAAVSKVAAPGSAEAVAAAIVLALMSGIMLVAMGLLRLGFVANLLSHPVVSGFITASGILIAASQLRHILGIEARGETFVDLIAALWTNLGATNVVTLALGSAALAFLFWVRKGLKPLLQRLGLSLDAAGLVARMAPVFAIVASIVAVASLALADRGVAVVGDIPAGLPNFTVPLFDANLWLALVPSALLISIIGFVESVSVAQTLAAKRRQSIDPDQELIGLGSANVASALSGGFPVTGGFSRSVVNFDAGAQTPAAGAFTAVGIALASLFLTPLLYFLPIAVLAATIIVAVLSLVDFAAIKRTWDYSRFDFAAMSTTIVVTLLAGVEAGVIAGVATSIALLLWRTSRPHVAVVGQVPGTEHYRNVDRHDVLVSPHVLTLRIDESLTFANARAFEGVLQTQVARRPDITDVVLQCSAINAIDASALESLELSLHRLSDAGIRLHLSEVKGPVMDRLRRGNVLDHLTGHVWLTQHQAMLHLAPDLTRDADAMKPPAIAA